MRSTKGNLELLLLASPGIIFILIIKYIPMSGVLVAFKDFKYDKGFWGSKWVGFRNFEFFFGSQDAWRVVRNTVGLNMIFIATGLLFALIFALLLYEITKRLPVKIYQVTMIFPHFLSWVVVGFMFYAFFNVQYGMINGFLDKIGIEPVDWYAEPEYWPVILTIVSLWKNVGWNSLIYYAALMGINTELYEAAKIDGASRLQMVKYISIPFLVPLVTILVIFDVGRIFNADFGMFFNLARDIGPLYPTTDVIDTYVYRALKTVGDIGMSSAVGLYQSVVGFVLVMITNYTVRKINPENSLF